MIILVGKSASIYLWNILFIFKQSYKIRYKHFNEKHKYNFDDPESVTQVIYEKLKDFWD